MWYVRGNMLRWVVCAPCCFMPSTSTYHISTSLFRRALIPHGRRRAGPHMYTSPCRTSLQGVWDCGGGGGAVVVGIPPDVLPTRPYTCAPVHLMNVTVMPSGSLQSPVQ